MYKSLHIRAATVSVQWRNLLEAIRCDDVEAVASILETRGWPADASCSDVEALTVAAKLGRKRIVQQLLERDCRVFVGGGGVNTPLHYAVRHGAADWSDVIVSLLEKGCRVSDVNASGKTAVHVAFKQANASGEDIDFLLRRYLDTTSANVVSNDGLSTLHIACTRPDATIVESLLKTDDSLIDQTICETLHTPLHYAVKHRRHQVVRVLLERGADIYKRDVEGSTPLHWSLWTRDVQIMDIILSYDERKQNAVNKFGLSHFMVSCAGSDANKVRGYVETLCTGTATTPRDLMSTRINKLGSYSGYTPLHFATEFGWGDEIVRMLLQYGADCCATTCYRLTPHSLANMKGNVAISSVLQQHCCSRRADVEEISDEM